MGQGRVRSALEAEGDKGDISSGGKCGYWRLEQPGEGPKGQKGSLGDDRKRLGWGGPSVPKGWGTAPPTGLGRVGQRRVPPDVCTAPHRRVKRHSAAAAPLPAHSAAASQTPPANKIRRLGRDATAPSVSACLSAWPRAHGLCACTLDRGMSVPLPITAASLPPPLPPHGVHSPQHWQASMADKKLDGAIQSALDLMRVLDNKPLRSTPSGALRLLPPVCIDNMCTVSTTCVRCTPGLHSVYRLSTVSTGRIIHALDIIRMSCYGVDRVLGQRLRTAKLPRCSPTTNDNTGQDRWFGARVTHRRCNAWHLPVVPLCRCPLCHRPGASQRYCPQGQWTSEPESGAGGGEGAWGRGSLRPRLTQCVRRTAVGRRGSILL